jgi:hypothetical protein
MAATVPRSADDRDWHPPIAEPARRGPVNANPHPQSCAKRMTAMATYCPVDFFVSPRLMPRQYVIESTKLYAACARVGYRLDPDSNERVDVQKLNAAIKESNASIDERFRLREILGVLHLTER